MMFRVLAGICLCFVKAHDNEHSPRFRRSIYEVSNKVDNIMEDLMLT